jgi:hypothetical protein
MSIANTPATQLRQHSNEQQALLPYNLLARIARCACWNALSDSRARPAWHAVIMQAESVFEAATRGLAQFIHHAYLKAELSLATILVVRSAELPRAHRVQVRRLLAWFAASGPDRMRAR